MREELQVVCRVRTGGLGFCSGLPLRSQRCIALLLGVLAACGGPESTASSSSVARSGESVGVAPPSGSGSSTSEAPKVVSAPPPTASATAVPASTLPRSNRPTPLEWCRAPVAVLGEETLDALACRFAEVREWVLVWCPVNGRRASGKDLGTYDRALPGGGSLASAAELEWGAHGPGMPKDAIVVSLRPGTKAKPTFTYRPPENPTWLRDESFTFELPATATDFSERRFNGSSWPRTEARETQLCDTLEVRQKEKLSRERAERDAKLLAEDAQILEDVEGLAPPPDEATLTAERSALVTGSDALGCVTKVSGPWFWMKCGGKVEIQAIEVEKGRRKTQTTTTFADGVATLLTPYVEETDLRVRLEVADGPRFLKVRWPKGKRPFEVGRFVTERQ